MLDPKDPALVLIDLQGGIVGSSLAFAPIFPRLGRVTSRAGIEFKTGG